MNVEITSCYSPCCLLGSTMDGVPLVSLPLRFYHGWSLPVAYTHSIPWSWLQGSPCRKAGRHLALIFHLQPLFLFTKPQINGGKKERAPGPSEVQLITGLSQPKVMVGDDFFLVGIVRVQADKLMVRNKNASGFPFSATCPQCPGRFGGLTSFYSGSGWDHSGLSPTFVILLGISPFIWGDMSLGFGPFCCRDLDSISHSPDSETLAPLLLRSVCT